MACRPAENGCEPQAIHPRVSGASGAAGHRAAIHSAPNGKGRAAGILLPRVSERRELVGRCGQPFRIGSSASVATSLGEVPTFFIELFVGHVSQSGFDINRLGPFRTKGNFDGPYERPT